MSDTLPAPLVPAEVDLRDFAYMELDVRRLRDSRFGAEVTGDAFRAGVMLWCACWHQVPAGSVPDDDIELANLAGYGRFVKEWKKSRTQALQGFVKCSDGRLYHEVVAEKANAAWTSKLRHHYDRACDRLRKANKARREKGQEPLPELTFEAWNEARIAGRIPMERAEASAGIPQNAPDADAGIPAENALRGRGNGKGEGEGEGDSSVLSEAIASGADAPPKPASRGEAQAADDPGAAAKPVDVIFALGLPLLTAASVPEQQARSFLGLLRKEAKGRGGDPFVVAAIERCIREQALKPVEFLRGCFKPAQQPQGNDIASLTQGAGRLLGFDIPPAETIDAA